MAAGEAPAQRSEALVALRVPLLDPYSEFRHNSVVKLSPEVGAAVSATSGHDRHTRGAIVQLLLEAGPITAGEIGERLGISAAGVRRHLDALLEAGDALSSAAASWQHSGRGRPARRYRLTAAGRAKLGHTYDDLAVAAMRQLREIGGDDAVRTFARRRIDTILSGVTEGSDEVETTVDRVADRTDQGRLRRHDNPGQRADPRHTALPTPLPGVACGRGVPGTVRNRAGRLRRGAGYPRAAVGHDRQRRLRLHHARAAQPGPATSTSAHSPRRSHHDQARSVDMTTTPEALTQEQTIESLGRYGYGWADSDVAGASAQRGLSEAVVRDISGKKNEPEWMLESRLRALRTFNKKPMPNWGSNLEGIHFDNIKYFVRSTEKQAATWDDLPEDIRNTYDKLGIPEAEKQRLVSGVAAQYESEVVYHQIREDLEAQGVIFLDTDSGLREHPELFKQYFSTVIPAGDNKFSALNTAVWSGGSFIYVPPGVRVDIPLQAYFRINTENMGQFERTLIIVDEGAYVHYVEGCTAPIYKSDSLHSAVVEIIVKPGGRCRYTTIQNWSNNVYNLVTKRARAEAGATMEWIDGNIGSKVTMKYPSVWMTGEHAKGEVLSVAFAGEGQHQDTGAKMLHLAPNTSSNIVSKSVARGGGRASYRGLVQVNKGAHGSRSSVKCDALLVDTISRSDTYPYVDIREDDVTMGHEATVSKVSEDQLFYLMSRGMTEDEAMAMVVRGFVEPIAKELPMEYALELNRLIELQMEGAVG